MGRVELIFVVLPIIILVVGALAGSVIERRHLASLALREQLSGPILTDLGTAPAGVVIGDPRLVYGEAVLGADRGREFVSTLRNFVGGEVVSLQKLLTRARREARLRMVTKLERWERTLC